MPEHCDPHMKEPLLLPEVACQGCATPRAHPAESVPIEPCDHRKKQAVSQNNRLIRATQTSMKSTLTIVPEELGRGKEIVHGGVERDNGTGSWQSAQR